MNPTISWSEQERERIADLVGRHHVVYEMTPATVAELSSFGKSSLRTVGYDLSLMGKHAHELPRGSVTPGCPHCVAVWRDLAEIARAILPKKPTSSAYEIRTFDQSLHMDPRHHMQQEVELVVEIRHRSAFFDPPDACELECLTEMQQALRALGAHEISWPSW